MTASVFTEASTSRFARIKEGDLDLQLHYNDVGQGAETVVMLHGSGPGASGWANFNRNIEPLVTAGYRVILLDCPGWSKSDPVVSEGSRSNLNASALKGLLDVLELDRVHIIGNSMGAHSTVAFAHHRVTFAPAWAIEQDHPVTGRHQRFDVAVEVGPAAGAGPGAVEHDHSLCTLADVVVVQLQVQAAFLDTGKAAGRGFSEYAGSGSHGSVP